MLRRPWTAWRNAVCASSCAKRPHAERDMRKALRGGPCHRGAKGSRTLDLVIANDALWPTELPPRCGCEYIVPARSIWQPVQRPHFTVAQGDEGVDGQRKADGNGEAVQGRRDHGQREVPVLTDGMRAEQVQQAP